MGEAPALTVGTPPYEFMSNFRVQLYARKEDHPTSINHPTITYKPLQQHRTYLGLQHQVTVEQ